MKSEIFLKKKTHLACWLLLDGCSSKHCLQKENKVEVVPSKETQAATSK
jgi:hypothetical protein